ncbi:MAG: hypothetical protein ACW99Q_13720 [Candidatus Kariarchaeaceae archaeon]|jgi:hypothetical protein
MNIVIIKQVLGSDGQDVVNRAVYLPFTPFPGLVVLDEHGFEAEIQDVVWKIDSNYVQCWTKPDKSMDYSLEELLKEYKEMGWSVPKKD